MRRFMVCCLTVMLFCSCSTIEGEQLKKQYESKRLTVMHTQPNDSDILTSFLFTYAPQKSLYFSLYKEDISENQIDTLYLQETNSEKTTPIFQAENYPEKRLNLDDIHIELYSYHVLYLHIDGKDDRHHFEYWIYAEDYLAPDQIDILHKQRPAIKTINDCKTILFVNDDTNQVIPLKKKQQKEILEDLSSLPIEPADCQPGPSLAVYATFYMQDSKETHQIEVSLRGILYDGVLYSGNHERIDQVIKDLTGSENLY